MANDKTLTPAEVKQEIIDLSVDDVDRSEDEQPIRDVSKSKRLYVPTTEIKYIVYHHCAYWGVLEAAVFALIVIPLK